MPGGRESGHVRADLGDEDLGGSFAHPGDRVEAVTGAREGGRHLVDVGVERGDAGLEVTDVLLTLSNHAERDVVWLGSA